MKRPLIKIITPIFGALLLALGAFLYGTAVGRYRIPPYQTLFQVENTARALFSPIQSPTPTIIPPTPAPQTVDKILEVVKQHNFANQTEVIDFVREFVYHNSIHIDNGEGGLEARFAVDMIYDHYANQAEAPRLLCGSRARAMIYILEALNIQSRYVIAYTDEYTAWQSHVFLEALNPDTGQWEVQDPDYDIYWINTVSQKRLSLMELVFRPLETLEPVSTVPEEIKEAQESLGPHYFKAVVYRNNIGTAVALINTDRFSPDPQHGYAPFMDYLNGLYQPMGFIFNQTLSK